MRRFAVPCFSCVILLLLTLPASQSFADLILDYHEWQDAVAAAGLVEAWRDWSTVPYGDQVDFLIGPIQFEDVDAGPGHLTVSSPAFVTPSIYGFGIIWPTEFHGYLDAVPYNDGFAFTGTPLTFHVAYHADTPIPEPGTLLLLSTGLIGLAGYGIRRRKKA